MLGRFTAIDPVDWNETNPIHSFNRYAYANNNPLKYIDPDGRDPRAIAISTVVGLGLGFAAGYATGKSGEKYKLACEVQ